MLFYSNCGRNLHESFSYKYVTSEAEITESVIQTTPVVVDLCIDFNYIVSDSSDWRKTKLEAIEEAKFRALQKDSSIHTLVAPIYAVKEEISKKGNKETSKFQAEVVAFRGRYCGQYNLIEAIQNSAKIQIESFHNYTAVDTYDNTWINEPFHVGEIYIEQSNSPNYKSTKPLKLAIQAKNSSNLNDFQTNDSLTSKLTETKKSSSQNTDSISSTNLPIKDSILTKESLMAINDSSIDSNNTDVNTNSENSIYNEKITINEFSQNLYANSIIRDSSEKIVKNGKNQLDFILHNDDYISRWMKENESLKKQLVMFQRILENETSFLDLKYKAKRNEKEDLEWGKIDYYLLELEYLNRNKLLFYSNFNLLRSKKIFEDCYVNAPDSVRKVVKKYMDIAENWISEGNIPMQINSEDQLLKSGLPIRKRINAEYFAAEIYYRAWEICQGKKVDFLSDTLIFNKPLNPLNDSVQWKEADSFQQYAIKNDNSAKFNEKEFPKGSYLDLMQRVVNLPDTLKLPIFSTYPSNSIPNDFDFPTNITYPRGIIYVVQVGAFKKKIEPSFYEKFAPVVKEAKGDGVYRYTAGFFPKYGSAQIALRQIKQFGYKDAFIVALKDGVRIPLPEKSVRLR